MFIVVLFLIGSITSHMQTKFEKKSRNVIVAPYYLVLHNYNRSYTAEIKWYRGNSPYLTTESRRCKPTISSPLSMISRWFTVNSWQMNTIYEIGQSEWINAWLFTRSRIYSVEVNLLFSFSGKRQSVHISCRIEGRWSNIDSDSSITRRSIASYHGGMLRKIGCPVSQYLGVAC